MKKVYTIIFCALTLLIVATGCNYDKIDNFKSKKQPVSIRNFIMGEGTYEKLTVQLVLTKGEYFDIDHTIPSGGVYEENYQGKYVLKVLKNKEVLSSLDLGERNIGKKFTIKFSDYNNDKNVDFTIGDWAGSNYNDFVIYTIDKKGDISDIGKILTSEGKNENDYSMGFEHDNNIITTKVYDNEKGKLVTSTYIWDCTEKQFIINS